MRNHWPLKILALLFISPVLAAIYALNYLDRTQLPTIEHGTLLQAEQIASAENNLAALKWQILYLSPANCDATCMQQKQILGKLQLALGADQDRVVNSAISATELKVSYPERSILILNPTGHSVMYYPPNANYSGMLKDIKRLLKYSHA